MSAGEYTDPATKIKFATWTSVSSDPESAGTTPYTFGLTLPADALTKDATEYIGILVGHQNFSQI